MILLVGTVLVCLFTAALVWFNNKGLSKVHASLLEKHQLTLQNKNLAVLKDAKLALQKAGDFEWRLDKLIIELRQGIAFLKEQNLHQTHAEVREMLERIEHLAIETGMHHRDMESLLNDPRVQRAIKSG